jgi:hypothetical protein
MPSEKLVTQVQMIKYYAYGASLKATSDERAKQEALRDKMPYAKFAKMIAKQPEMTPETHERILAEAIRRSKPNARPAPVTEMERLIASEPKSSAQVIGHHAVPDITIPPRKRRDNMSELEQMRTIWPERESHMVGFHHDFGVARVREAAEANELVSRLSADRVRKDEKLATALTLLKNHVIYQATVKDVAGMERGIVRR